MTPAIGLTLLPVISVDKQLSTPNDCARTNVLVKLPLHYVYNFACCHYGRGAWSGFSRIVVFLRTDFFLLALIRLIFIVHHCVLCDGFSTVMRAEASPLFGLWLLFCASHFLVGKKVLNITCG